MGVNKVCDILPYVDYVKNILLSYFVSCFAVELSNLSSEATKGDDFMGV